jgi:outer membrane protein
MKKISLFSLTLLSSLVCNYAAAAGLVDVYNDAIKNDQTFKQAEATLLQNKEMLPQARALLLPQVVATAGVNRIQVKSTTTTSGTPSQSVTTYDSPYTYGLNVTQSLFNAGAIYGYEGAKASVAQAAAVFSSASQSLMVRVATAYFAVLQAEETLVYAEAQKKALESQLHVSKQRYQVGLDPITSVYQAQAAYDAANSNYIASQNGLLDSQEDLRVITNQSYPHLNRLQYGFNMISPEPADIDAWSRAAVEKNLDLKGARFGLLAAQDVIKAQQGNRLPTLNLVAGYNVGQSQIVAGSPGTSLSKTASIGLNAQFDAYTGGAASSLVRQAEAAYQLASAVMEQSYRQTVATTRKSYWGVMTGISKVEADRQSIKSSISALESTEAGYKVGTQTFNDVLQQQQLLYQSQTTYAQDRFNYLLTTLQLKQAVGVLSTEDLIAIDAWLAETNQNTLNAVDKSSNMTPRVSGKAKRM